MTETEVRVALLAKVREGGPSPATALIEELAAEAHESWSGWMTYQFAHGEHVPIGMGSAVLLPLRMPLEKYERWHRQAAADYDELSPQEQESDRLEVMRTWPVWVEFVASWLGAAAPGPFEAAELIDRWRRDMGMEG